MAIPVAVFMCHAPIVIPAVGGARSAECADTTAAMTKAASALVAEPLDALVVISPHTPRRRTGWGVVTGDRLTGDMSRFGAPQARIDLPIATGAVSSTKRAAADQGLSLTGISLPSLDHGAYVPMHFVFEAGWRGPVLLLNLPWDGGHAEMGRALRAASTGQRWGILASGDMSHKLIHGAPAGFDPRAAEFDRVFSDALRRGDLRAASDVDAELRELAAEDAVDSLAVAAAAVDYDNAGHQFFSYEGPFGVGYCEAVLHRSGGVQ